jgi:DNA modification methylase
MPRRALTRSSKTEALLPGFENAWTLYDSLPTITQDRLPTNTTTRRHRIHRWFNFIAGFSPEFVHQCCTEANLHKHDMLLDPFAGCATSLVVACERGLLARGYDPHPIFGRIARAKLPRPRDLSLLHTIHRALREGLERPANPDSLGDAPAKFLAKLFAPDVLSSLVGARQALFDNGLHQSDLAFLVLSRVLEQCSHAQTDGIYKAPTTRKRALDPITAIAETVHMIEADLVALNGMDLGALAQIYGTSSERMKEVSDDQVSIVVTSPPYLNNFDFAEMTRMHLYFWGIATSWGEITDTVRRHLVINTTTALKDRKSTKSEHRARVPGCLRAPLDRLVFELATRRKLKAGKKEYHRLVYPYFAQITSILRECYRCLRTGGPIHIIVADAALYGVHISTPQFLRDALADIGFRQPSCDLVRRRGHRWLLDKRQGSTAGLGEYHVSATK